MEKVNDLTRGIYSQRRSKSVHVRVTPGEWEYLNEVANVQGYKIAGLIRLALQKYVSCDL
jgi:hypothetical protein